MFQFLSSDAEFFRRQMPTGLMITNAGCAFLMFSLFAVKSDFREVAFYITPAPTVFLVGASFAFISLALKAAVDDATSRAVPVRSMKDIQCHESKIQFLDGCASISKWMSLATLVLGLTVTNMALANLAHGDTETYAQYLSRETREASQLSE